jgi:hypothetical protein
MATPPDLKASFNKNHAERISDSVLMVHNGRYYYFYDFALRVMTTAVHHGGSSTPFSQLDRETLVEAREKLISLGGNPPELPAEKPATGKPGNKFNL